MNVKKLCTEEVPVRYFSKYDDTGTAVYSGTGVIRCRSENDRQEIMTAAGEKVISEGLIISVDPVKPGDVLTLDGAERPVLLVGTPKHLNGTISHYEVRV